MKVEMSFDNHKIKHSFHERASGIPDIIFLLERHRPRYDPSEERRCNDEVIDALYREQSAVFVEKPEGESIDTATYPRTKSWKEIRHVEGCFDEKYSKACDAAYGAYLQVCEIPNEIQQENESLVRSVIQVQRQLYEKMVVDASAHHADVIIKKMREWKGEGPIFFVLGKNHVSFPKKRKLHPKSEDGVRRIHDFLESQDKWAVVMVPKKAATSRG